MNGITDISKTLNKQKAKVFFLFLCCSFMAWSISKLSETYESQAVFDLKYTNIPDTLMLQANSDRSVRARIRATGFQFVKYAMGTKVLSADLQKVLTEDGRYFLTANNLRNQLERQFPNSVSLLEMDEPIYYIDLYAVATKKVPVVPKIDLQLEQNYLLSGKLKVQPDSIKIKGPKNKLAQLEAIYTVLEELKQVSGDFSKEIKLEPIDSLGNIEINTTSVKVSGEVVHFSEKEFTVKTVATNVPQGYRLRMFPDEIKLLCKAGVERLKQLQSADFEVSVDYNHIVGQKFLLLELTHEPEGVLSVRLLQDQVEFVLEKL